MPRDEVTRAREGAAANNGVPARVPMISLPGRRSAPEWIGATPDSPIPPHVKLRIWEREEGRCYLTGRKIMPGEPFDYEHVKSIRNGGENRETNIKLALREKHREKSAVERSEGAKADRVRQKHLGLYPSSKAKIKSRGFQKTRPV